MGVSMAIDEEREGADHNPPHVHRRLPIAVRQRIVVLFAQFHKVSEVRDIIRAEYGLQIADTTLRYHDPGRSPKLSPKLKQLFKEARKRHLDDVSDIGIAHQSVRLRMLARMASKAEEGKQYALAASLLKQAAEEMGGALSGTKVIEHRGHIGHVHLSADDMRNELALRLGSVLERAALIPPNGD